MSLALNQTSSQSFSITERVSQNFNDHKWEILIPGPVALTGLALSVVFLLSNPFGWVFSAGLVGTGIALAALNAIAAIGYSLYLLLKEPRQINNLVTYEPPAQPKQTIELQPPPPPPPVIELVQEKSPPPPVKKKIVRAKHRLKNRPVRYRPGLLSPYVTIAKPEPKSALQKLQEKIVQNPGKSALLLGAALLGWYGLSSAPSALLAIGAPARALPAARATLSTLSTAASLVSLAAPLFSKTPPASHLQTGYTSYRTRSSFY